MESYRAWEQRLTPYSPGWKAIEWAEFKGKSITLTVFILSGKKQLTNKESPMTVSPVHILYRHLFGLIKEGKGLGECLWAEI